MYIKDINFPKNLIYILTSPSQPSDIRCLAGTTLKGQMESNLQSFTPDTFDYFKSSVMSCYFDRDSSIRKTVSNLVNTFIRHCGIDVWPEFLEVIESNIDKKDNEMSIETLNLILEDSRGGIEDKFSKSMNSIIDKILFILQNSDNEQLCNSFMNTLTIFLESCQAMAVEKMRDVVSILKHYSNSSDGKIKHLVGKCWYIVIHLDKSYLNESYEDLINFYLGNFNEENYEKSFVCAEFFQYLIDDKENFIKSDIIKQCLKSKLNLLIPALLQNMKLSENDINYLDNKFQNETINQGSSNSNSGSNGSSGNDSKNSSDDSSGNDDDDNGNNTTNSGSRKSRNSNSSGSYNPEFTLRKCCARVLDNLSCIFPHDTFSILRINLENDIQSTDDLIKERSILAFGAIGRGCYQQVINHLRTLIPFLIRELQHPNKFVRAIACWTLSRYTKYTLVDNYLESKNELFKEYLTEILIKFLDKEILVRESSGSAFQEMILVNKNLVEPYLFDVFKIIASVFDKYTGQNLLSVYEILILIMETYGNVFHNQNFVDDIVKCLVQKWYELVKENDILTLPSFFDVISSLIKVSGEFLVSYCDYFLTGCLKIIEQNVNEFRNNNFAINGVDKDLLTKAIDMISNLTQYFPSYIKNSVVKSNIVDFLFELMKSKDLYIIHYVIALFGDLLKADSELLMGKAEQLLTLLIPLIDTTIGKNEIPSERLSVCNNSIWTVGLMGIYLKDHVAKYTEQIIEKFKSILIPSKVYLLILLYHSSRKV